MATGFEYLIYIFGGLPPMRKKSLIILGISLLILIITITLEFRINGITSYSRSQLTDAELQSLLSTRSIIDSPLITDILIDDQKLIYDVENNTFYCSKVEGKDFKKFTIEKNHANSIREVLGFDLIHVGLLDDKLVLYDSNSISISNFVVSTLPFINISVSAETVADLGLDETYNIEQYTGAELYLYDNRSDFDGRSRSTYTDIKIHVRGGTTINLPQKSYRITLLEDKDNQDGPTAKENLLGLRYDDDWILYAPYSDYEKVRNVFSMNLWNATSAYNNEWNSPACNEYVFTEVFFNNRYHGLYAFSYPMDSKQLDRQDDETIIQKKDWAPSEYSQDVEYNEDFSYDWLPGYYLQKGSPDAYHVIHDLFYAMAYSGDNNTIRSTVDMDNAIDLYLFYELSQAADNVYDTDIKNLFVVNKPADNQFGCKLLLVPWDMDQTWGNRYVDGLGSNAITSYHMPADYELPIGWGPVPFLIANGDETITVEVKARYATLRDTVWSNESILAMLDSYESDIYTSGAFERTMERWPDGNYYDSDTELSDFKDFVLTRLSWMDEYVKGLQ